MKTSESQNNAHLYKRKAMKYYIWIIVTCIAIITGYCLVNYSVTIHYIYGVIIINNNFNHADNSGVIAVDITLLKHGILFFSWDIHEPDIYKFETQAWYQKYIIIISGIIFLATGQLLAFYFLRSITLRS